MGATYGHRLIIPGTLFGVFFLSIFLYLLSAALPFSGAFAAQPAVTSRSQLTIAGAVSSAQADGQYAAAAAGECLVSDRYPGKILQWCDVITRYALEHGLEPNLVAALIWQESGGNPVAYSKSGAVGLMQVMPSDGIAASFMCVNGPCFSGRPSTERLQDPEFNVSYGTRMLAGLLSKNGNLRDALKAYGPMNVGYYYADKVLGIFQTYAQ